MGEWYLGFRVGGLGFGFEVQGTRFGVGGGGCRALIGPSAFMVISTDSNRTH